MSGGKNCNLKSVVPAFATVKASRRASVMLAL